MEVKIEEFDFADVGQLGGYVVAYNHIIRKEGRDNPQSDYLSASRKTTRWHNMRWNQVASLSEYELEKLSPEKIEGTMPSIKEIEAKLDNQTNC